MKLLEAAHMKHMMMFFSPAAPLFLLEAGGFHHFQVLQDMRMSFRKEGTSQETPCLGKWTEHFSSPFVSAEGTMNTNPHATRLGMSRPFGGLCLTSEDRRHLGNISAGERRASLFFRFCSFGVKRMEQSEFGLGASPTLRGSVKAGVRGEE